MNNPQEQAINIVSRPIILSLYDWSMSWCKPYFENGYRVFPVDIKWGIDILKWDYKMIPRHLVYGILAAPPCTDFAGSGAQYWKEKDLDGRTEYSLSLVRKVLELVDHFQPTFWVMENPVGRLNKLLPELEKFGPWYFHPYEFGDPWTKKTGLWGIFNKPIKNIVEPIKYCEQCSYTQLLGGKSERTKELRSVTPSGFSYAFYEANKK